MDRDKRVKSELKKLRWNVLTIWDCELKNKERFNGTMKNLVAELNKASVLS